MQIGASIYTNRADAAKGLALWALDNPGALYSHRVGRPTPVGTIGRHTLTAHAEEVVRPDHGREISVKLQLAGVPRSISSIKPEDLTSAGVGTIRAIENKVTAIAKNIAILRTELDDTERVIDAATARIGQPFAKADELARVAAEVKAIDAQLAALARGGKNRAHSPTQRDNQRHGREPWLSRQLPQCHAIRGLRTRHMVSARDPACMERTPPSGGAWPSRSVPESSRLRHSEQRKSSGRIVLAPSAAGPADRRS